MLFEWDDDKNEEVRAVRGIGFADVIPIFHSRTVEWQDERKDYGERRMIAIGEFDGIFYTVVYTDRGPVRRIITAWPSERWEQQLWLGSV